MLANATPRSFAVHPLIPATIIALYVAVRALTDARPEDANVMGGLLFFLGFTGPLMLARWATDRSLPSSMGRAGRMFWMWGFAIAGIVALSYLARLLD